MEERIAAALMVVMHLMPANGKAAKSAGRHYRCFAVLDPESSAYEQLMKRARAVLQEIALTHEIVPKRDEKGSRG